MHLLWWFEIRLPPIYNLIEFSPNDQIQPNFFSLIKRIDIYISSYKLLLNRLISMEVRFNTFPMSWWLDNFPFQYWIIFKRIFLVARYRACPKKVQVEPERAKTASPTTASGLATSTTQAQKEDDAALVSWNRKPRDVSKYPIIKKDED